MAGNGQKPRRRHRQYGDAQKQAALLLALRDGVAAASEALDIPERTIYTWFERAGGLAEIRAFTDTAARVALSLAEQAVCEEVAGRVQKLTEAELMATYRKLIEVRATTYPQGGTAGVAGAQATAKTEIHVHVDEGDKGDT